MLLVKPCRQVREAPPLDTEPVPARTSFCVGALVNMTCSKLEAGAHTASLAARRDRHRYWHDFAQRASRQTPHALPRPCALSALVEKPLVDTSLMECMPAGRR